MEYDKAMQGNVNTNSNNIKDGYECNMNGSNNYDQGMILVDNRTNHYENNNKSRNDERYVTIETEYEIN